MTDIFNKLNRLHHINNNYLTGIILKIRIPEFLLYIYRKLESWKFII